MKNNLIKYLFVSTFFVASFSGYSQDMLSKLEKEYPKKPIYELATFKTTRIGLGQSVEVRKKGALEISVFSRFWNREDGETTQKFLADEISMRFGLNYAITDNLTIGGGYTNFDEVFDGFLKYKVLKQQKNNSKAPVSITLFQGMSNRNRIEYEENLYGPDDIVNTDVNSFASQILIARKFNQKFSAQLSPTYIRNSKSFLLNQPLNQFAVGLGLRYKVGGHVSIVSEYYYNVNPVTDVSTYDPFMIGVNWELSHLLLQFQLSNTRHVAESPFITQTQNNFNFHDGNFHFGFNAIFVLHTNKNKL